MKKLMWSAAAVTAALCTSLAMMPKQALAMTAVEYWEKTDEFLSDPRWENGTSWAAIAPKLSNWTSSGCCAYTADFAAYVYGASNQSSGEPYYSVSDVRTGDIIHTGHHWFVVVERDGDQLRTAEGNARLFGYWFGDGDDSPRVMVSDEHYYISGNCIIDSVTGGSIGFAVGYHNDTGGATTPEADIPEENELPSELDALSLSDTTSDTEDTGSEALLEVLTA